MNSIHDFNKCSSIILTIFEGGPKKITKLPPFKKEFVKSLLLNIEKQDYLESILSLYFFVLIFF